MNPFAISSMRPCPESPPCRPSEPWTSHCVSGFCPTKCAPQIAPADGGYVAALVVDPPAFIQPMKAEWSTISLVVVPRLQTACHELDLPPLAAQSPQWPPIYMGGRPRRSQNVPPAASSLRSISCAYRGVYRVYPIGTPPQVMWVTWPAISFSSLHQSS